MSLASGDVWHEFVRKLKAAGYQLADLDGCTNDVFQSVVQELGGFSALQTAKLLSEWQRQSSTSLAQRKTAALGTVEMDHSAPMVAHSSPINFRSQFVDNSIKTPLRVTLSEKSTEFVDAASRAKHFLTTSLAATVGSHLASLLESGSLHLTDAVVIEKIEKVTLPPNLERRLRACQSSLLDRRSQTSLRWKLCREAVVEATCINGFSSSKDGGEVDHLCTSGTVFYAESSAVLDAILHDPQATRSLPHGSLSAAVSAVSLGHDGYPGIPSPFGPGMQLVGAEVLLGKVKTMDEEDVPLLSNFSTDKCFQSLQEDGFDSIVAQRTLNPFAPDAFVTFHRDQAVARYIVTYSFSNRLNIPASFRQHRQLSKDLGPFAGSSSLALLDDASSLSSGGGAYLNPPSTSLKSATCPEHPMKELEFWCADEKKLLCSHCMFYQGYNKRNCALLEDAVASESKDVERWVSNADAFVKEMGGVIVAFDKAMEGVERAQVEQISQLKSFVGDAKRALDDLVVKAEAALRETTEVRTSNLQNSLAAVVGVVHDVETVLISVKESMRRRRSGVVSPFQSSLEMLAAVQQIHQPWKAVAIPPYAVPALSVQRDAVLSAISQAAAFSEVAGPVPLPEAIDANCLLLR